ncbi:hypothetical protein QR680_004256 [Steinernema hermaphroditum]|uniref:Uncharacterized protein n=1 Tax=Steinernema hermaphroditum TaxID=289476 RepID=A0AA39LTD1_9BILA|nr:hypothetical protein QR680_004256 [Steinernema hermaphroditum]
MKLEKLDASAPDGYWAVCNGKLLYFADDDASKLTIRSLSTGNTSSYKTECEGNAVDVFNSENHLHMVYSNNNVYHAAALRYHRKTKSFTLIEKTPLENYDRDYLSRSTMYLPESNKLYSLKSHRTYDISDTGELAACFEHRSQIFHLKNLGGMTFLKSVHIDDTQTQETCNKVTGSCGEPFALRRATSSFVFGQFVYIVYADWKLLKLNMRSIEDVTKLVEELSSMNYLWSAQDDQAIYFERLFLIPLERA